jgi:hypothetical protein
LIATASAVILFSSYGGGQVRIIALISMAIGFALWHKSFGRFTFVISRRAKKWLTVLLRLIYRYTLRYAVLGLNKAIGFIKNKRMAAIISRYDKKQKEIINRFAERGGYGKGRK